MMPEMKWLMTKPCPGPATCQTERQGYSPAHRSGPAPRARPQAPEQRPWESPTKPRPRQGAVERRAPRGYARAWTKYDPLFRDFYRSVRLLEAPSAPVKVMLDVLVEPSFHLSLYGRPLSTDDCVAVVAARALLARG